MKPPRVHTTAAAVLALLLSQTTQAQVIRFEMIGGTIDVSENVGTIEIGVLREGATNSTSRVGYVSSNIDPSVMGQLVFAPGENRQVIRVPIADDADEGVGAQGSIALHSPEGATLGGVGLSSGNDFTPEVRITIRDNEFPRAESETSPATSFPAAPSALISGGVAEVALRRLGYSHQTLTVNVATADLTAKAGVHYVAQSHTVVFAPLETEKNLSVPLLPGPVPGREAALELTLSGVEAGKPWTQRTVLRLVDGSRPGTVDPTFDVGRIMGSVPDASGYPELEDLVLLPDGRIYIGGHISSVQGISRDGIARLMPGV